MFNSRKKNHNNCGLAFGIGTFISLKYMSCELRLADRKSFTIGDDTTITSTKACQTTSSGDLECGDTQRGPLLFARESKPKVVCASTERRRRTPSLWPRRWLTGMQQLFDYRSRRRTTPGLVVLSLSISILVGNFFSPFRFQLTAFFFSRYVDNLLILFP